MDEDDLEAWKLCWQVNLFFYQQVAKPQKCILCLEDQPFVKGTRRSVLWLLATQCSVGHTHQKSTEINGNLTLELGICASCDRSYVFDVVKGKHTCKNEGCRRVLKVDQAIVKSRIDEELFDNFLTLLKRYRVYECAIHCDDVEIDSNSSSDFAPPTTECDHDRKVCDDCLRSTFEAAIRGGRLQDLVCPDPECKKAISLSTIRQLVSVDVFKIYNKKLALKTISGNEKFRWCTCGHGQIHGPGESNPEWKCLSCKKRHCFICPETTSSTCEHLRNIDEQNSSKKIQQRELALRAFSTAAQKAARQKQKAERGAKEREEAANQREKARTTKKCPKASCAKRIERNEGCGHMTCHECKTDFCWSCKVIWNGGNALHVYGCRIGTNRTIAKNKLDTTGYAPGWDQDKGYDLSLDKGLWLTGAHQ